MAIMLPKDAYDTGLGKAISEPLLQLINQKMQHVNEKQQRSKTAQNLALLEGVTPEHAWGLSGLPEGLQKVALNNHYKKQQQQGTSVKQALAAQQDEALLREKRAILTKMKQLKSTGKVASGFGGYGAEKLPQFLSQANKETQEFNRLGKQLVTTESRLHKGQATEYKLKLFEATKPNLGMSSEAQDEAIESMLNELQGGSFQQQQAQQGQPQREPFQGQQPELHEGEDTGQWLGRHLATAGSRAAASIAGLPGDIASAPGIRATNEAINKYMPDSILGAPKHKGLVKLPTTGEVNEKLEEASGGYLKPTGFGETFHNALDTVRDIFLPGKGIKALATLGGKTGKVGKVLLPFTGAVSLPKAIGITAAGEAGSKAAEILGAGEGGQALSKIAFMTAASTAGTRKALAAKASDLYKEAETSKFGKHKVDSIPTIRKIDEFDRKLVRQATPHRKEMNEIIDSVRDGLYASKGEATVADFMGQNKNINARFGWTQKPTFKGEAHLPKELAQPLGELGSIIREPIESAVKKYPKESLPYLQAQDIYKGLKYQGDLTKWISKNMNESFFKSYSVKSLLKQLAGAAGTATLKPGSKLYDLLKKSPAARQEYKAAIIASLKNNKIAALHAFTKLDKLALEKEGD